MARPSHWHEPMAMHALDSATISFGLVAIPIKVYTTNETAEQNRWARQLW